jgi:hypothetical protein
MPQITFTVVSNAPGCDLIVEDATRNQTAITLNAGVGTRNFDSGFAGDAKLTLTGGQGTKATFAITQGATDLGKRDFIKITSPSGRSKSTIPFLVQ